MTQGTKTEVKVGSVVRLARPEPGEEDARYVVTEVNGDRLFARYICDLPFPPIELLLVSDVVLV